MKLTAAADSTKGLLRKINQDNILLKTYHSNSNDVLLAVVCDGVGGLDCGEIASSYVVDAFARWFDDLTGMSFSILSGSYEQELDSLVNEINAKLINLGNEKGKHLGTTLTAIVIVNNEYHVIHIGDTRLYFVDTNSIVQLTKDHTEYERRMDKGDYEAASVTNKNILWQCVGGNRIIEPQVFKGVVNNGTFVLCSDGFRKKISEKELLDRIVSTKVRTSAKLKIILEELINMNLERNEKDNISAILIDAAAN